MENGNDAELGIDAILQILKKHGETSAYESLEVYRETAENTESQFAQVRRDIRRIVKTF